MPDNQLDLLSLYESEKAGIIYFPTSVLIKVVFYELVTYSAIRL